MLWVGRPPRTPREVAAVAIEQYAYRPDLDQATERLADYEGERLHHVFRTVAPVLPPDRPEPYVGKEFGRIVHEDPGPCRAP